MAIHTTRMRNTNNNAHMGSQERTHGNATATIASLTVDDPKVVPEYLVNLQKMFDVVFDLDQVCISASGMCLDDAISTLEGDGDVSVLSKVVSDLSFVTKSLHGGVSKLSKMVDAYCHTIAADLQVVDTILPNPEDSEADIHELIVEHVYASGQFQSGDCLAREAGIEHWEEIKRPYITLFEIEKELKEHRLDAALAWVDENAEILKGNVRYIENRLPFMLHRLYFLDVCTTQGPHEAIQYARKHMQMFYATHGLQMQQLLGGLAFYQPGVPMDDGSLATRRYGLLFSPHNDVLWDEARAEFRRQFCYVINKPQENPLLVSVSAGSFVLPTLLKYSKVAAMGRSAGSLPQYVDHLPVELPLPDEFAFHSTFTCPVSKESNTESDPALMLPCGHCLNKSSILKLAKGTARKFKCPYCPSEAVFTDCKELHFV